MTTLTGNLEFDAAAHILRAPILRRAAPYIHEDWIDFEQLLIVSGPWSHGEKLMVDAALDMWNGDGKTTLMDLIGTLDNQNFVRVMEAVAIRRGTWR